MNTAQAFHVKRDDGAIDPADLHRVLAPTATLLRTFPSEKKLQGYRRMIYAINKQGEYRYRTVRAETEMWGLIIWRMV